MKWKTNFSFNSQCTKPGEKNFFTKNADEDDDDNDDDDGEMDQEEHVWAKMKKTHFSHLQLRTSQNQFVKQNRYQTSLKQLKLRALHKNNC